MAVYAKSVLIVINYLRCLNPACSFGSSIDYWPWTFLEKAVYIEETERYWKSTVIGFFLDSYVIQNRIAVLNLLKIPWFNFWFLWLYHISCSDKSVLLVLCQEFKFANQEYFTIMYHVLLFAGAMWGIMRQLNFGVSVVFVTNLPRLLSNVSVQS